MSSKPKISLAIPTHNMKDHDFFINRCLESIYKQSYKNYEIVITTEGKMAENTNAAIKKCTGDIVKVLYMDDFLAHEDSLKQIVAEWPFKWLASSCNHINGEEILQEHYPTFNGRILKGVNTIGSPSVLSFENKEPLLFDEQMSWLLDVDLYRRLYERYGLPTILNEVNVTIGLHDGQMTHLLTDEEKVNEFIYLNKKYE